MITFRKKPKIDSFGIFVDDTEVGWIAKTEDRDGWYWAWSSFSQGRFKGTASRNIRLPTLAAAKADIREYLCPNVPS